MTNTIFGPEYEYKYIWVDLFLANTNISGLTFFGKYKYKYTHIPFCRPIQIQIYSGLPKMGEYEYNFDYLDYYSRIQIQIQILSHTK